MTYSAIMCYWTCLKHCLGTTKCLTHCSSRLPSCPNMARAGLLGQLAVRRPLRQARLELRTEQREYLQRCALISTVFFMCTCINGVLNGVHLYQCCFESCALISMVFLLMCTSVRAAQLDSVVGRERSVMEFEGTMRTAKK